MNYIDPPIPFANRPNGNVDWPIYWSTASTSTSTTGEVTVTHTNGRRINWVRGEEVSRGERGRCGHLVAEGEPLYGGSCWDCMDRAEWALIEEHLVRPVPLTEQLDALVNMAFIIFVLSGVSVGLSAINLGFLFLTIPMQSFAMWRFADRSFKLWSRLFDAECGRPS